jgi:DNA-binding beta-propeller fold protein YncE
MNAPGRVAFDAAGNAWAGNNFAIPGTSAGLGLTALSPSGQPILGSPIFGGGVAGPGWGTAVGADGRVWNANFAGDSVSVSAPDGRPLSPPGGHTAGRPTKPQGIAVGPNGDVWVASFGDDSVIRYPGGTVDPTTAQKITGGGIEKPFGVQVDARGHAWVTNGAESARGSVTELLPDGTPARPRPIRGGGLRSPQGLAFDSGGNVWVANLGSRSVTMLRPDGRITPESPLRGSIAGGWGVAVDGADHVWVAGFLGANVTELCGIRRRTCPPGTATGAPISPPRAGYESAGFEHMTAVQIDPSGNVWLANNWTLGSSFSEFVGGNGLVQLVGAATPVRTPLIGLPRRP